MKFIEVPCKVTLKRQVHTLFCSFVLSSITEVLERPDGDTNIYQGNSYSTVQMPYRDVMALIHATLEA